MFSAKGFSNFEGLEEAIGFDKQENRNSSKNTKPEEYATRTGCQKFTAAGSLVGFMKDNPRCLGFSGGMNELRRRQLLQAAGYHVTAPDARCRRFRDGKGASACRSTRYSLADAVGAGAVQTEVVDYFTDSYFRECTPAPCTRCSSRIKWPCLGEGRRTGDSPHRYGTLFPHYLRRRQTIRHPCGRQPQGPVLLPVGLAAGDHRSVPAPMGTLVIKRNIVEELADRQESMGVCFLEGRRHRDFLRSRDKTEALRPGPIIDSAGHRLLLRQALYHHRPEKRPRPAAGLGGGRYRHGGKPGS